MVRKDHGEKEVGEDNQETAITHSICPECRAKLEEENKEFIKKNNKTEDD